jgi:hypothetical protein
MFRSLTASILSLFLLFAATMSLNDETVAAEWPANVSGEPSDIAFGDAENREVPEYPEGISQRLLRKRISPRALIGERGGGSISSLYYCDPVYFCTHFRSSPQALYHHQTSLRI